MSIRYNFFVAISVSAFLILTGINSSFAQNTDEERKKAARKMPPVEEYSLNRAMPGDRAKQVSDGRFFDRLDELERRLAEGPSIALESGPQIQNNMWAGDYFWQ